MAKIISISRIGIITKTLKKQGKKFVLIGGCFDILHPGHVIFLEKAKKWGDFLIVLLESDEKVKKLKGPNRPVHTQKMRAKVLSALQAVDYVVMLPAMEHNSEYDDLVRSIRPNVIAATAKDTNITYHQRAANLVGAKLKLVTPVVGDYSTSSLISSVTVQCKPGEN